MPAAIAAVLVALGSWWYVGSPWVTLYNIQAAAERRDVEALIGYVDFEALRADMKAQVHAAVARRPKPAMPPGWSAPDTGMERMADMDRQIDAFITPETARAALGNTPSPNPRVMGNVGDVGLLVREVEMEREGLGRFVVRGRNSSSDLGLVFTAHGFGWRLSGIRLPDRMIGPDIGSFLAR